MAASPVERSQLTGSLDGSLKAKHPPAYSGPEAMRYLLWYYAVVNWCVLRARHRRTLARVNQKPAPADIRWEDVESLLRACGGELVERSGSMVGLSKDGERIVIHRPHLRPAAGRATVRDIAAFLRAVGGEP